MLNNVQEITVDRLVGEAALIKGRGCRFVTITCTDLGDVHDLIYHFDDQGELRHLRLKLPHGAPLPSLSGVFFAALIIENEIQDLFGITVTGLAIDYQGRFILAEAAPRAPFNRLGGMGVDVRVRPADAAAAATAEPATGGAR